MVPRVLEEMSFDTERFIQEIENRPCLWNNLSKDYLARNLRKDCWEEIVNIFKENNDMTKEEVKLFGQSLMKKWKSIRGCYTREVNRQRNLKHGQTDGPRKSEYAYFKLLQFLKDVVTVREPDVVTAIFVPMEDAEHDKDSGNNRKRMKPKEETMSEDDDKSIESIVQYDASSQGEDKSVDSIVEHDASSQDEDMLFMMSLVNTMKRVPQRIKMATKIKIMSILDEATRNVT